MMDEMDLIKKWKIPRKTIARWVTNKKQTSPTKLGIVSCPGPFQNTETITTWEWAWKLDYLYTSHSTPSLAQICIDGEERLP